MRSHKKLGLGYAIAVGVLSLGLLASPAATPIAAAESPPMSSAARRIDDRTKLTHARKLDLKATASIYKHSVSRSNITLNYSKAKAYDKGRVTARRKFASAWLWRGHLISHISKAEKAKVKAYSRGKRSWASINGGPSPAGINAKARNCRGRSETTGDINIASGRYDVTTWMDSCDVKSVLLWSKGAAGFAGLLAAGGWLEGNTDATFHFALVGAYLAAGREIVSYYADTSDIGAIWMRDHWHVVSIGSQ